MTTTAGRVRRIRRSSSGRDVSNVWNEWSAAERYRQAMHLYLPRSMARMAPAVVARGIVVVVMCKLRVGGRTGMCGNVHVTTPRLALVLSFGGGPRQGSSCPYHSIEPGSAGIGGQSS
jgi:hypothetical protein